MVILAAFVLMGIVSVVCCVVGGRAEARFNMAQGV